MYVGMYVGFLNYNEYCIGTKSSWQFYVVKQVSENNKMAVEM
jgi:hypothetical protein